MTTPSIPEQSQVLAVGTGGNRGDPTRATRKTCGCPESIRGFVYLNSPCITVPLIWAFFAQRVDQAPICYQYNAEPTFGPDRTLRGADWLGNAISTDALLDMYPPHCERV